MLVILLICLPALLVRYVVLKRPVGLGISLGASFVMLIIATALNFGQGVVGAGVAITFFTLYQKKKVENFFYSDGSSTIGPIEGDEMLDLYTSGVINSQTPVVREGEQDWKTLGSYRYLPLADVRKLRHQSGGDSPDP